MDLGVPIERPIFVANDKKPSELRAHIILSIDGLANQITELQYK